MSSLPVPPVLLVVEESAWKKGVKSLPICSFDIPHPVSRTSNSSMTPSSSWSSLRSSLRISSALVDGDEVVVVSVLYPELLEGEEGDMDLILEQTWRAPPC